MRAHCTRHLAHAIFVRRSEQIPQIAAPRDRPCGFSVRRWRPPNERNILPSWPGHGLWACMRVSAQWSASITRSDGRAWATTEGLTQTNERLSHIHARAYTHSERNPPPSAPRPRRHAAQGTSFNLPRAWPLSAPGHAESGGDETNRHIFPGELISLRNGKPPRVEQRESETA
jgi:hypothetical protein